MPEALVGEGQPEKGRASRPSSDHHPRFRLLCDFTDAEADGLAPPYTRGLALEYILYILYCHWVLLGGFIALAYDCWAHKDRLSTLVSTPWALFHALGSYGYDNVPDTQYRVYVSNLPTFALLAAFTGLGSSFIRRCQSSSGGGGRRELGAGASEGGGGGASPCRGSAAEDGWRATAAAGKVHARRAGLLGNLFAQTWSLPAFHACVGLVFVSIVHGPFVCFPLGIMTANYFIFTTLQKGKCPYGVFMTVMWVSFIGSLYIAHQHEGFQQAAWAERLAQLLWPSRMRWHAAYRMYILRMVAFNYDMWEANRSPGAARERALQKHATSCLDCAMLREQEGGGGGAVTQKSPSPPLPSPMAGGVAEGVSSPVKVYIQTPAAVEERDRTPLLSLSDESLWCYKLRTEYPRPVSEYNYLNYAAYMLYTPVYLAGPITSFNAFVSHVQVPSKAMPAKLMVRYVVRLLFVGLLLTVLMHYAFVNALSAYSQLLTELPISHQAYVMYFYLAYLWLKFTIMWRCSRLFSFWCGIEVPENMRRCFSNTYSVRDFWRDWHASFNLWIVRYMYIPMGGRKRILFSIFPIFFFIAIWHDHALHLLKWALCIVVMFAVEIVVSSVYGKVERRFMREMEKARENGGGGGEAVCEGQSGCQHSPRGGHREGAAVAPLDAAALQDKNAIARSNSHGNSSSSSGCRDGDAGGGGGGGGGRRPRGLWQAAATYAALRLSRQARRSWHRILLSAGAALTVFGLICSNLIGYSIQNLFAFNIQDTTSHTDRTILNDLRAADWWFYVGLGLAMWAPGAMSTVDRLLTAAKQKRLQEKYGLTAPPPIPNT